MYTLKELRERKSVRGYTDEKSLGEHKKHAERGGDIYQ